MSDPSGPDPVRWSQGEEIGRRIGESMYRRLIRSTEALNRSVSRMLRPGPQEPPRPETWRDRPPML